MKPVELIFDANGCRGGLVPRLLPFTILGCAFILCADTLGGLSNFIMEKTSPS